MKKSIVIYDGDCGICEKFRKLVERLDWLHQFECRPFQNEESYLRSVNLSTEDCQKELKLIEDPKHIYGGANAAIRMCLKLPLLTIVGIIFSLPPFLQIARWLYPKIAENRYRFSAQCGLKKKQKRFHF